MRRPVFGNARGAILRYAGPILQSPYMPVLMALAAVVFSLPTLGAGFLTDDFMHRSILIGPSPMVDRLVERGLIPEGSGRLRHALSQTFVAVHPDRNLRSLKTYGALPWWTYDGFQVALWRPVASVTQWLDYRLFPQSASLMHLHSILWFAAAVLGVAVLYRQISLGYSGSSGLRPTVGLQWVGGLAALMYVLDNSGYFPTMWLANRNLLISVFFGAVTIVAHDRWRRSATGGWRPGAVLAPACLLLSVLATEGGIATFAYLLAYEAALGSGRPIRRLLALVPSIAVVVLWRLAYNRLGYGASAGGFYSDPVREPLDYMAAVLLRAPFFLAGQWTSMPADLYNFLPPTDRMLLWAGLVVLTVLIPAVMIPLLRTNPRARFWLIGMYLCALPVCATVPMGRAMLFIGIGAFGVVAEYIGGWLARDRWRPTRGWTRHIPGTLFVVFFVAHLPLAVAGRLGAPRVTATMQTKMGETMDLGPAGTLDGQELVVVNAPNPASFLYEPFRRACEGRPLPRGIRVLAPGFNTVDVTRTGPRRLTIRSASDSLLDCQPGKRMDFAFFYRSLGDVRGRGHPLRVGDRISLPPMEVEVLAVDGRGFPVEAAFEFKASLDDSSLKWMQWDWDEDVYRSWTPPAAGQSVRLMGPF